ncbi:hypothetical protein [Lysobacter claricitrinus]|uniref:hypothetical protein n=1 Tax=Lysobacter claricitrinus TaxID=3367728 RepID=UPI0037DB5164
MELQEPWYAPANAQALEEQLRAEVQLGHALHNVPVEAIAARQDRDDVLFALKDGSARVAVVHLAYAANSDARWPSATFFADMASWLAEGMARDCEEFNA